MLRGPALTNRHQETGFRNSRARRPVFFLKLEIVISVAECRLKNLHSIFRGAGLPMIFSVAETYLDGFFRRVKVDFTRDIEYF
jgi:hypothetical protein